jgi:hypothetical protein
LAPQEIRQACARKRPNPRDHHSPREDEEEDEKKKKGDDTESDKKCQFLYELPEWRDHPGGAKFEYRPKFNTGPTMFAPVMVSGVHFGLDKDAYVVQPMHWGLVPSWHKVKVNYWIKVAL